jgi:hypothetical protein
MPFCPSRSLTRFSTLVILAISLPFCGGCSKEGPLASTGAPAPRKLGESEITEIKQKAKTSQELRKLIRSRELGKPEVVAAPKATGRRTGNRR